MQKTLKTRYIIGIDCGVNTGFAVWDCTLQKLIEVKTYSAHTAWAQIRTMKHFYGAAALYVRFEDARLRTWFGTSGLEKLQGAGSIKRDSTLWEEFCEMEGIQYEAVAPKHNKTKTTTEYFKMVTGWAGSTSNHARDAAMMIYRFIPLKSTAK